VDIAAAPSEFALSSRIVDSRNVFIKNFSGPGSNCCRAFLFILIFIFLPLTMNTQSTSPLPHFPESNLAIPYAWQAKGIKPGPTVTILGGVHGNERVGVNVVKMLLFEMAAKNIIGGTLKVALGNIDAIEKNVRFIQKDLNRCFGNPKGSTSEEIRAQALKAVIAGSDALIDVHSTIKPSDPFVGGLSLDNPLVKQILPHLGIHNLMTGPGWGSPTGEPIYADTFAQSMGALGLTVEAGGIDNPETLLVIKRIRNVLQSLGILKGDPVGSPIHEFNYNYAYENIVAQPEFSYVKEFQNFETLPAGTVYAEYPDKKLAVDRDSQIVFPKSKANIVIGSEAGILVEPKRILTL